MSSAVKERSAHCTIGKYEVIGTLGRGSMGIVYKARDPEIGREVAVKTLRTVQSGQFEDADAALQRFRLEARSAGSLRHPNIITIFEVNRDGDTPFLVMDYVEGQSLDALLHSQGPLDSKRVLYYLFQIAAGLDHAHSKGVIHRDIKPSNLHVDPTDRVYILDFGVATITETFSGAGATTGGGPVVGTPGYMSPEQILSEPLDARSDLFSLAAVAFECLTTKRPFPGETFTEVVGNILAGRMHSLTDLAPYLPLALEAQFARALSRDKNERFSSAQEMALAFCEALGVDPADLKRSHNSANLPEIPRKRKSTGWRSFRALGQKDKTPEPASQADDPGLSSPWEESRPLNWKAEEEPPRPAPRGMPGDMFTRYEGFERYQQEQSKAIEAESRALRRLTVVVAGVCIALGSGLLFVILGGLDSPQGAQTAGEPIRVAIQAPDRGRALEEAIGLSLPAHDAPPQGVPVSQMTDRQLLGLLVDEQAPEALLLQAIEQARQRSMSGLVEASAIPLRNESYLVRVEMVKLLAELGDKRIVPELMLRLDDHDPLVRGHAARALGLLGDRRALGYLHARYQNERSPEVKSSMKRAIERIQGFSVRE